MLRVQSYPKPYTIAQRKWIARNIPLSLIQAIAAPAYRLEYVDGRTMRDQYLWASQSDIIIYVHGAIMGNFAWLSPV